MFLEPIPNPKSVSETYASIKGGRSHMRRRIGSVVEHSSTSPKVPGSSPVPSHTRVMDYNEWYTTFHKAVCV